jgi:hypothetical protein
MQHEQAEGDARASPGQGPGNRQGKKSQRDEEKQEMSGAGPAANRWA